MDTHPVGTRVVALVSLPEDGPVPIFGYGVYVGNFVPPGDLHRNPRIDLDGGGVVWGYQCWWFPLWDILTATLAARGTEVVPLPVGD